MSLREQLRERRQSEMVVRVADVSRIVGCSRTTVRRAITLGELPAHKVKRTPKAGAEWEYMVPLAAAQTWGRERGRPGRQWAGLYRTPRSGFGAYLRELRSARDLSQRELGRMVGCADGTISHWEVGASEIPSVVAVRRLADALECSPYERLRLYDLAADSDTEELRQRRKERREAA